MALRRDITRTLLFGTPVMALLLLVWAVSAAGLVLGNATTSVPRGLYLRANAQTATYVTFCLDTRHRQAPWYPHLCSPDAPDGLRILKRIAERRPDGSLIVKGDTPGALDSRVLGPVRRGDVRGWWMPLLRIDLQTASRASADSLQPPKGRS